MYTDEHVFDKPKLVPINQVKWKEGDAFETEITGRQYLIIMVETAGFYAFNFDSRVSEWLSNTSFARVRRLDVRFTTSYQK